MASSSNEPDPLVEYRKQLLASKREQASVDARTRAGLRVCVDCPWVAHCSLPVNVKLRGALLPPLVFSSFFSAHNTPTDLHRAYDKTEEDLKVCRAWVAGFRTSRAQALQSVGQMIGEVLRQLDDERFIVKTSSGPRYVVGCRRKVDRARLKAGTRVALDMTTYTIMRTLPREVDPMVFSMSAEDPGAVSYHSIGGLNEQLREIREVIELPLTNPELFVRGMAVVWVWWREEKTLL